MADVRAKQGVDLGPIRIDCGVEGPGVQRVVGLAAEVEIRHEQVADVFGALDPAGREIVQFLRLFGEQAEMGLRCFLPQLFHRRGRSIFLEQINQHFLVQIGGVHIVQGLGVANFPVPDEVAVQAAGPAHAAL